MNTYEGDVEAIRVPWIYHENVSGSPSASQTTSSKALGSETPRSTRAPGLVETMTGARVRISTWPYVRFVVPQLSVTTRVTVKFPLLTQVWVPSHPLDAIWSLKSQS